MGKGGVANDFENPLEQSSVWRAKDSPASLCGYVEFASAERICYVCFARNSIEDLVELASVVPGPMGANQVVEWLMFASPCEDGMFGSLIVAQLDVRCCE